MIFDAILSVGTYILGWIVEKLPTSTGFGTDFHDAMSSLGGYLDLWTPIFPVETMSYLLGLVIGVELSIFGFKTLKWVISHVPQIGGRG